MAAGRWYAGRGGPRPPLLKAMAGFSLVSMLPDADVIAFTLRIPYQAPLGHRGASHSIAAAVAVSVVAFGLAQLWKVKAFPLALLTFAVAVSHPLLDTLTSGGLGCALWWPWSNVRVFAPLRLIPVSPIGVGMLSMRGLRVVVTELGLFSPFLLYALWPRRRARATS